MENKGGRAKIVLTGMGIKHILPPFQISGQHHGDAVIQKNCPLNDKEKLRTILHNKCNENPTEWEVHCELCPYFWLKNLIKIIWE